MEKNSKKLRICLTLLALNVAFIWGNSLLPGEISGAISLWVKRILEALLGGEHPGTGHGLLRKLAHFTEFACLGALLTWLASMYGKPFLWALAGGFLVACADETIQCFVPDRGPAFTDVLIDTAGVLLGIGVLLTGYGIYRKKVTQALEDKTI